MLADDTAAGFYRRDQTWGNRRNHRTINLVALFSFVAFRVLSPPLLVVDKTNHVGRLGTIAAHHCASMEKANRLTPIPRPAFVSAPHLTHEAGRFWMTSKVKVDLISQARAIERHQHPARL